MRFRTSQRPDRHCSGPQYYKRRLFNSRLASCALITATLALAICASAVARSSSAHPYGLRSEHLDAEFWVSRAANADDPRLDASSIETMNTALRAHDDSIHRIEDLPAEIPAADVRTRIEAISAVMPDERFDRKGNRLSDDARAALRSNLALDALTDAVLPRFALVVRRSSLRGYPTLQPAFSQPGDVDIDRLQESALFPATPVAALHRSADRRWWFVVSERYAAWIEDEALAFASRDSVLAYAARQPTLTVIGAEARTVVSPEAGALSDLRLEMGVRIPVLLDWPVTAPVNRQLPLAHWVVELPQRTADGALRVTPTLIARSQPVARAALPYSSASVIRQGFRFLGERYGWGHDLGTRDCSGFVSEVYSSMGILLPRNTRDQAVSPVFDSINVEAADEPARQRALASLSVGDLIYIPGHVMMVIGHDAGDVWLIHDAHGIRVGSSDQSQSLLTNGVTVTPLRPLLASDSVPLTQRITRVQRIRPRPTSEKSL